MDSDTLQVFQSELTCSICMNCFLDPVSIDCGHSFCRPCLSLCWEEGQTPRSCPECRGIAERPHFKTNIVLKRLASLARQARADHDHRSEEQICETHQEARGLFCEADQTLLCGPCSERPEHAAHSHSPIHGAAEESREKLLKRMGSLWKIREEMKIILNQEAKKTRSFKNYVSLRKKMIIAEYQRMLLLLREEEQLHLEALEQEAKEICEQLKESVLRMTQYREHLKDIYRELTAMCCKPDRELLQVRKEVDSWTDLAEMQKPQPVNPELTCWPVTGILDMLNNFRVDNILSQTMTIHHMSLSEDEDDASVMFRDEHHGTSRQPQIVESVVSWGVRAFTSGRHYWELDVTHSSSWILGTCKDILITDTNISIYSEEACVLFSKKVNNHYSLFTNTPPYIQYVKRPLGRIGVFLDYDNGTVSFYDVCRGSLIYSFLPSPFSFPLKPFLCLRKMDSEIPEAFEKDLTCLDLVSTVRKANLRQSLKCEEQLCGTHQQTKTIFCEAGKSLLCLVCSQGQEHKTHRHCPTEEAAEESWELGDKLKWGESAKLHVPQPLLPELPARPMAGLMHWLHRFRGECHPTGASSLQGPSMLVSADSLSLFISQLVQNSLQIGSRSNGVGVNFSFDNEVSSQHIRLFDDARCLTYDYPSLHASLDGRTSKYFAAWGAQSFTSGKQYWEMLVDRSWD
ncbi:tripartite motif-containing protein 64-like [Cervus elaphus]|uniref:tripartite motif-containing protein 64-like n=1 Tax=Cervus elaphus TaxID=9860 RepID=UPI001CC2C4E2|nr:tripartite motif-containing protein 64-like [Cervus elaphus]